ncbi:MAG: hypothetical protein IJU50_08285 [Lachnospiraceae bacterium]|nr:hypothetical protein [Lachnospiraceae bacterium]
MYYSNFFIPDEKITPLMFRELCFLHRSCGKKHYEPKVTSLLEEFSSATPNFMMREFFITLLMTNLSALIKAGADKEIKNKSRPQKQIPVSGKQNICHRQGEKAFYQTRC